ncbi:iron complex outermembrane receptor protein [Chitinophaga niastensis]|uniref:Iron complex outermembrane receptor protein n=1 Tax=Chitinophaga niastensis TaxID=536980 RepID=A0A2P8HVV2_CHINA|nr:TonB-dependent receptor [Chitinophaga niastensis]PSL50346.1 iron complex outermembrane receptor protein [Chitinophaga niastensis]
MKKMYSFAYLVMLLLLPAIIQAQNELSGIIKDAKSGMALPGVFIYIPDLETGAVSDVKGSYAIKNIPSGFFLIETSIIGYARQIDNISIKGKTQKNYSLTISQAELQEIILTGVSSATEWRKNPVPSTILTQKNLLQNVSGNIIDALQTAPGVSQITEGPAISKPVIRGLGYNRVVVVNDGVRQEGQQWGDEFGIEIDEYTVNRVEILKGPSSLSYGSDAMAGVINFLAPAPLPEGKIKGSILANYQTNNGLYAGSFNLAGNQNGFIWDFRYTKKQAHDYANKYDGYVWNSGYGENDFKAIIGLNKKWGYSHLRLSVFDLKLGIIEGARDSATGSFTKHFLDANDADSLGIAPVGDYTKYNNYPIIHQHVRHYKAVLDNNFILGEGRLTVKLGLQQNYRQEANDITRGDIYNNYFFLRTINYDAQYIMREKNKLSWSFGVNGMGQSSEDRGIVFLVPEYNLFDIGVFSIAKKTMGRLTISGGLRFDSRNLQTKDLYIDSNAVRLNSPNAKSINRFTAHQSNFSGVSGSLGATYDVTENVYGKLNFSRGFRAPTIAESGSDGIHDGTPFYEIGDPNLKAESSFQVDASIGINTEDFSAELNTFVNKINNYIFPVKLASVFGGDSLRQDFASGLPAGSTFKYVSGDAVISGGELTCNIHPQVVTWLSFENSFSLIHAILQNQGDSTKYLPYTPPQKLLSTLRFSCKKINGVFQNAFFRIGMENYFKQDKIYYKFGNETVTPGYTLINAGIGTDIYSNNKAICSIYISGNNLADVAYQSNMSRVKYGDTNNVTGRMGVYSMGRNFSIKLIIPFNIKN